MTLPARMNCTFETAGSEAKCEQIRALGAEAINYREAEFAGRHR